MSRTIKAAPAPSLDGSAIRVDPFGDDQHTLAGRPEAADAAEPPRLRTEAEPRHEDNCHGLTAFNSPRQVR